MVRDWELSLAWNVRWFQRLHHCCRHPWLDVFYQTFYHFGKGYSFPLFFLILWQAGAPVAAFLVSMALVAVVLPAIKYPLKHYRPGKLLDNVHSFEGLTSRSFPSADAAYAAALAAVSFFAVLPLWLCFLLTIYALLINHSRIYLGAHFPLDVLVGSFLGISLTALAFFFF
jgi:membrane-associated phospholipid phosphatase